MSGGVELDGVSADFGSFRAVHKATVAIKPGEFFSFLGPSGCGKTTILRMISGFVPPSEGTIRIGGQDVRDIRPNKRPTVLIFQNLALFPLMPVWENIAFGLEVRGVPKPTRRAKAEELLRLVDLPGAADKAISQLSGGQKQRVAIARALAVEPKVMLLDEPLSALDLKLRQHMRAELRAIQKRTNVTFIYITHDQGEALTMSDRIAVMNEGVIEQVGDGKTVYDAPATAFVASFVGENNPFHGRVTAAEKDFVLVETAMGPMRGGNPRGLKAGDAAILFVRPESFRLGVGAADGTIESTVQNVAFEGNLSHIFLKGPTRKEIVLTAGRGAGPLPEPGATAAISFAPEAALALPEGKLASE
jgi:spermidine/putrescine transport system ATP-binding protein